MSRGVRKGLTVAAIHLLLVASLGAKLLVDRATRPRAWARTVPYDPDLPIRGRYVRLRIEAVLPAGSLRLADTTPATADGSSAVPRRAERRETSYVLLDVRNGQLVGQRVDQGGHGARYATLRQHGEDAVAVLDEAVAYFIPEHIPDPSNRPAGEELWVEVTLPRAGLPRPIRLGVKKDGALTPLEIR